VVKPVDTADLKSAARRKAACGFDPRLSHHLILVGFVFAADNPRSVNTPGKQPICSNRFAATRLLQAVCCNRFIATGLSQPGCCNPFVAPMRSERKPLQGFSMGAWSETWGVFGGASRNRTDVHGFAGRCITTLPSRHIDPALGDPNLIGTKTKGKQRLPLRILERETRLELATSTLARLRSTN
jgi:hypothetical protein